ncbi:MAG TPA: exo-alpha-sialidase [Verrucomicrobiota bacterium]|nr:neuraminidase (sialidase)-like protein [Verrucomicrobiales bacterium]HRI13150.1 exo-alpha-sialidase [Verrucomicrobiota bacterium]
MTNAGFRWRTGVVARVVVPATRWLGFGALTAGLAGLIAFAEPVHQTEALFPPESWHNHGSSIVEAPNGDLFACWFHGSGERKADDVRIEAARRASGSSQWGPRFTLSDTPGYPDCNPALHVDSTGRLWLFYPTILNNQWEGALLKFRVSSDWLGQGPPRWERSEVLHLSPGADFTAALAETLPELERRAATNQWSEQTRREVHEYLSAAQTHATNLLYRRLGWMPRAHPLAIGDRLVLGVYHDGFSFSLMAITDDGGTNWQASAPLIGGGNIQPSLVRKRDGTLVAYMRDNGPPPKRLLTATSLDRGSTWGPVTDSEIPNPGSGAEVISLRSGAWVFIGNDTEDGRHRLSVWLSEDEGRTWPWRRALEEGVRGEDSFSYPSLIEAKDGMLHATYSVHRPSGKTIQHAAFNLDWIKATP